MNRRDFLKGSMLGVAGLLIPAKSWLSPHEREVAKELPEPSDEIDHYIVRIRSEEEIFRYKVAAPTATLFLPSSKMRGTVQVSVKAVDKYNRQTVWTDWR